MKEEETQSHKSNVVEIAPGYLLAGRYEVQKKLGEGGMGVVYKGLDRQLNQPVAIKLLKKHMSQNIQAVTRMKEEAQVAMMLSHPNIMRLINFERHDEYAYLLLEFIEGADLEGLVLEQPNQRYDPFTLAQIAVKICEGLEYAHQNNVIHRDIKPANIMICDQGVVKLMDFGIAKMLASQAGERASISGTLAYIAPEIFEGVRPDARVDIYALGLTIYELLAGSHPFSVKGKTTLQVIKQHQKLIPPAIDGVDRAMMTIIRTAIEKKPNARYQTAQSMRNAFNRYLNLDEKANVEKMRRKMEYEMRQLEQEKKKLEQEKMKMRGGRRRRPDSADDTQKIGANARSRASRGRSGKAVAIGQKRLRPFEEFESPDIREILLILAVAIGSGVAGALLKKIAEGSEAGYVGGAGFFSALVIVAIMAGGPAFIKHGQKLAVMAGGIGIVCALVAYMVGKPFIHFAIDMEEWSNYNLYVYLSLGVPAAIAATLFHSTEREAKSTAIVLGSSLAVVLLISFIGQVDLNESLPTLANYQDFIILPAMSLALWWVIEYLEFNIHEI